MSRRRSSARPDLLAPVSRSWGATERGPLPVVVGSVWLHLRWLLRLRLDTGQRFAITALAYCTSTDVGLLMRSPLVSDGPSALVVTEPEVGKIPVCVTGNAIAHDLRFTAVQVSPMDDRKCRFNGVFRVAGSRSAIVCLGVDVVAQFRR